MLSKKVRRLEKIYRYIWVNYLSTKKCLNFLL